MPKRCLYCNHYEHTPNCEWAAGHIEPNEPDPAQWSSPDPEATDRAEDNYMMMLAGENGWGPW